MTGGPAVEAFVDRGPSIGVPALVKGRLVIPPRIAIGRLETQAMAAAARAGPSAADRLLCFTVEEAQVIRLPAVAESAATAEPRFLIHPRVAPEALLERDAQALASGLHQLSVAEILDYAAALQQTLANEIPPLARAAGLLDAAADSGDHMGRLFFDLLPSLIDPAALGTAIDSELGSPDVPGRRYLDGWVEVAASTRRGMTAQMREHLFAADPVAGKSTPRAHRRAMPTRQLHITAGNSPAVPLLSFLWALATKGAAVLKTPAEATIVGGLLAMALHRVDPSHPITRHTSLVYWPGGDPAMESVLLARGAFDRVVVWGSRQTVDDISLRTGTKTVVMHPRYGVSLIGQEIFPEQLQEAAALASTDTMIADQRACTSSLVHYVEASEEDAWRYCAALAAALARWDQALPPPRGSGAQSRLRRLRRGALLEGRWFENGTPDAITSAVVCMPHAFDLSIHPMSRLVIVRPVPNLETVLPFLSSAVSTVGIFPPGRRRALRDAIAATGVSNVFPLGECELAYAGMPHDGMRVLSEMVNWVNG